MRMKYMHTITVNVLFVCWNKHVIYAIIHNVHEIYAHHTVNIELVVMN